MPQPSPVRFQSLLVRSDAPSSFLAHHRLRDQKGYLYEALPVHCAEWLPFSFAGSLRGSKNHHFCFQHPHPCFLAMPSSYSPLICSIMFLAQYLLEEPTPDLVIVHSLLDVLIFILYTKLASHTSRPPGSSDNLETWMSLSS